MDMLAHTMRMFIVGLRVGEEGRVGERRGEEMSLELVNCESREKMKRSFCLSKYLSLYANRN